MDLNRAIIFAIPLCHKRNLQKSLGETEKGPADSPGLLSPASPK